MDNNYYIIKTVERTKQKIVKTKCEINNNRKNGGKDYEKIRLYSMWLCL